MTYTFRGCDKMDMVDRCSIQFFRNSNRDHRRHTNHTLPRGCRDIRRKLSRLIPGNWRILRSHLNYILRKAKPRNSAQVDDRFSWAQMSIVAGALLSKDRQHSECRLRLGRPGKALGEIRDRGSHGGFATVVGILEEMLPTALKLSRPCHGEDGGEFGSPTPRLRRAVWPPPPALLRATGESGCWDLPRRRRAGAFELAWWRPCLSFQRIACRRSAAASFRGGAKGANSGLSYVL